MAWTLVDSRTAAFADGNTGHSFDLGASPQAGDIDVLFVNSDTTVSTPSGWTLPTNGSQVNNQGAYAFYRIANGTEGSTVTITTAGNFNAVAGWSRWRGGEAFEVAVGAQINGITGAVTPSIDTGTLAQTGELVIAAALLHRLADPTPTSPSWSTGYTALTSVTQGTGTTGCVQFVGYKTGAGTAAETPSCSWTNGAFDRYAIALAFTLSSSQLVTASDSAALTDSSTLTVSAPVSDTATLDDTAALSASSNSTDEALLNELAALTTPALDTAALAETAALTAAVSPVDAAAFTDTATTAATFDTTDSAALTETAVIGLGPAESATLSDSATLTAANTATDTATLAESASIIVFLPVTDTASLAETAAAIDPSLTLNRLGGSLLATDVLGGTLT